MKKLLNDSDIIFFVIGDSTIIKFKFGFNIWLSIIFLMLDHDFIVSSLWEIIRS